jgi:TP901-1 family phage major tail protein
VANMVKGIEVLIKVNTGTDETPVYTELGNQQDLTLKMTGEKIDTSSKSNSGWNTYLVGNRDWGIEGGAIVDTDDTALTALETAFLAGNTIKIQIIEDSVNTYSGDVCIDDFSKSAPVKDVSKVSLSLSGSSALTKA